MLIIVARAAPVVGLCRLAQDARSAAAIVCVGESVTCIPPHAVAVTSVVQMTLRTSPTFATAHRVL